MIFCASETSVPELLHYFQKIHEAESAVVASEDDILRMRRCAEFLCVGCDDEFVITSKPANVGCKQAVEYRFDLEKRKFGVSIEHEVKSLLYLSKDGKIIYYFLMQGSTTLPTDINNFAVPLPEERMKDYGLIPYTVNPATFLKALKEKALDLQVNINVDEKLLSDELVFVTNNCGSRYTSCSMTVQHFRKALNDELKNVTDKHGDRVCVSFHNNLSDSVMSLEKPLHHSIKAAKEHQMFINGDHRCG